MLKNIVTLSQRQCKLIFHMFYVIEYALCQYSCVTLTFFVLVICRGLSSTPALSKQWREEKGLPRNRNAEGVLTDTPDFTYLDGRPTPLLVIFT